MSLRSLTLRHGLAVAACAALLGGCPTGTDPDLGTEDGGADEASVTPEAGPIPGVDSSVPDSSKPDAAKPPVPCGRLTTLCKDGEKCAGAPDCVSAFCFNGLCKAPAPADGVKNGDETDVDCGGSKAPACDDTKGCLVKGDCKSGVCTTKICQAPTSTDSVQNGDETGVDCGGTTTGAPKCPAGMGCLTSADCDNIKCDTVQKKCLPAAHDDGIKNLDETGVDCGGPNAAVARCLTGAGCAITSDCANVGCNPGTLLCDPPTSTDGLKNGTETDVDCGGGAPTNAGGCAGGKVCAANSDCTSTACNYANKCAWARSCKNHMGGDTCGKGQIGEAGAAQEDCCTSVPLPGSTIAVDKYEITAGRMREFIAQTGGNVAAWVAANRGITGQIDDTMVQYLPVDNNNPVRSIRQCAANGTGCATVNQNFGVLQHLGNNVFMPDRPCNNCGQGCWFNTGAGQNGHPTYWWNNATQSGQFGAGNRVNTQVELDVKSLNCTPQLLFAAFCAWDGGRLPTQPELGGVTGAWGPNGMPWGGSSTSFRDTVAGNEAGRIVYPFNQDGTCPGNNCFVVPMFTAGGGYNPAAATVNTTNFNPFPSSPFVFAARHVFPVPANSNTNDQAYAVASPGRMRNDFRQVGPGADDGYYDIAANLIEVTATLAGTDNADHNGWPRVKWVGGSFEGHSPNNRGGYDLSVLTKYGKQGARCVHDIP